MRHGVPHRRAFGDSTARRRRAVGSERAGGSRGGEAGGGFCSGRGRGSGRFDRDARCGSPGRGSASRSRSRLRWIRVRARCARRPHRCRAHGRPSLPGVGGRSAHRAHGARGRAAHPAADGSVRLVRARQSRRRLAENGALGSAHPRHVAARRRCEHRRNRRRCSRVRGRGRRWRSVAARPVLASALGAGGSGHRCSVGADGRADRPKHRRRSRARARPPPLAAAGRPARRGPPGWRCRRAARACTARGHRSRALLGLRAMRGLLPHAGAAQSRQSARWAHPAGIRCRALPRLRHLYRYLPLRRHLLRGDAHRLRAVPRAIVIPKRRVLPNRR